KWPLPSLRHNRPPGPNGYLPGINRPPTKRSWSPSPSTSAARTQPTLNKSSGREPVISTNDPFELFKYNRDISRGSFSSYSYPPLPTSRSASPSPSASKNIALTSSHIESAAIKGCFVETKPPVAFLKNTAPACDLAPPTKISSMPSPFTSALARQGPCLDK